MSKMKLVQSSCRKNPHVCSSGLADYDFICNWLGNRAWTLQFKWDGHDAFNKAEEKKVCA